MHHHGGGQVAAVEGNELAFLQGDQHGRSAAVVREVANGSHDSQSPTREVDDTAGIHAETDVDHSLSRGDGCATADQARLDHAARFVGDHVDVRVRRVRALDDVPEDRDRRDVIGAGQRADGLDSGVVQRRVGGEGSGDVAGHDPGVGAEEVDGPVGLVEKPVVQCPQERGDREDEGGRDHADDDPTRAPLHVAQRDQNHGAALATMRARRRLPTGTTTAMVRIAITAGPRTSTRPTIATRPMAQPATRTPTTRLPAG